LLQALQLLRGCNRSISKQHYDRSTISIQDGRRSFRLRLHRLNSYLPDRWLKRLSVGSATKLWLINGIELMYFMRVTKGGVLAGATFSGLAFISAALANYVAEDGVTPYTAEDGVTAYTVETGTSVTKLSAIAASGSPPALADTLVGVHGGSTDNTFTYQQISLVPNNTQTASYTLALSDYNGRVEMNVASVNNLTIPLNATVAFPISTQITIVQIGAGQTTIVATGGVTFLSSGSAVNLAGQYAAVTLYKRATDTWVGLGALV